MILGYVIPFYLSQRNHNIAVFVNNVAIREENL